MGQLATLKFSDGSFEHGFAVTLQMGDEKTRPSTEISGKLPPNQELIHLYRRWQSLYNGLIANGTLMGRPLCLPKHKAPATLEECQQAAQALSANLNRWLRSESFSLIREKWLAVLSTTDDLRVLIQTQELMLQKLPWHLWDLLTHYPKAEIALSAPNYDKVAYTPPASKQTHILAILGNSEGIDTKSDRATLRRLAGKAVRFLPEPRLVQLTDQLWQQPWRILFFAGHSASHETGDTGRLAVNSTESLSLSQLKYALRHSVQRGLRLAIFNSCDGLGLARELADLQIPQLIVMREPVPDYVAQQFLKYFLTAFSSGKPLYQAVREARERLQGLETQFPCATWLPVIWQNPAEIPPTWQALIGTGTSRTVGETTETEVARPEEASVPSPNFKRLRALVRVVAISTAIAAGIAAGRFIGFFQPLELQAFDHLMRLRPRELPDPRLLIVGINDDDLRDDRRVHKDGMGSVSDAALDRLLEKLAQSHPRFIGLDIFRDFPAAQQPEVAKRLQQMPNVIAICRGSDASSQIDGIKPPPGLVDRRLGFADFVVDPDGIIRRHLLYLDPEPASPCTANYAFSTRLAALYLEAQGFAWKFTRDDQLQLGSVVFKNLQPHSGGYAAIDTWGKQLLLNYRQPPQPFEQVSLKQLLKGEVSPDYIKNRIVLVGYTAQAVHDFSPTPYGLMPGVTIHAHMTSQMLSAVQDGRSLFWTWPQSIESAWLWGWAIVSGLATQGLLKRATRRSLFRIALVTSMLCSGVCLLCYYAFLQGGWLPLVPTVLTICVTALVISLAHGNLFQHG
ncbi:MAG: CHASE2 domain-containing protein [Leptolyngbya sp. BL-A-14]